MAPGYRAVLWFENHASHDYHGLVGLTEVASAEACDVKGGVLFSTDWDMSAS